MDPGWFFIPWVRMGGGIRMRVGVGLRVGVRSRTGRGKRGLGMTTDIQNQHRTIVTQMNNRVDIIRVIIQLNHPIVPVIVHNMVGHGVNICIVWLDILLNMGGIGCIYRVVYYICSRFCTNVTIVLMVIGAGERGWGERLGREAGERGWGERLGREAGWGFILLSRWGVMIFDKDTITTNDTLYGIFVQTLAITIYKRIYRGKVRS